jgi:phospholipase D1/2
MAYQQSIPLPTHITVIQNSQHFVYIENQFFITATSDAQMPVKNKIGAAIVERILRAARAGKRYKVIVVMPAIPAFAGDLKDESSLGTRVSWNSSTIPSTAEVTASWK